MCDQLLISRLTGQVATSTHMSGYRINQALGTTCAVGPVVGVIRHGIFECIRAKGAAGGAACYSVFADGAALLLPQVASRPCGRAQLWGFVHCAFSSVDAWALRLCPSA